MATTSSRTATPIPRPVPMSLSADRLDAAAALLARAFFDDPLTPYLIPDPAQGLAILTSFMTAFLRNGLEHGHVSTLHDSPQAVAIWHVIDNDHAEMPEPDLSHLLSLLDEPIQERWLAVFGQMAEVHRRLMPQPHTYLPILGVAPEYQGRGLGSALIAPVLARSRSHGRPCYLETMNPINLPFYGRHGFRVVHEDRLPGSTITMWTMRHD